MPHAIVKQPNGRYAIWSSIVDDFLLLGASPEEAMLDELDNPYYTDYAGGKDALRADLRKELENIATNGRAWKWAPTWDEAVAIIRELHGNELAEKRTTQSLRGED